MGLMFDLEQRLQQLEAQLRQGEVRVQRMDSVINGAVKRLQAAREAVQAARLGSEQAAAEIASNHGVLGGGNDLQSPVVG